MRPIVTKWPFLLGALFAAILTGLMIPWLDWGKVAKAIEQYQFLRPKPVPRGPKVLLVSVREADRFSVTATLEPRGYSVLFADSTRAALDLLDHERERIALVVMDTALGQAKRLRQKVRSRYPDAQWVPLSGPRRVGQVSSMLIDMALD